MIHVNFLINRKLFKISTYIYLLETFYRRTNSFVQKTLMKTYINVMEIYFTIEFWRDIGNN